MNQKRAKEIGRRKEGGFWVGVVVKNHGRSEARNKIDVTYRTKSRRLDLKNCEVGFQENEIIANDKVNQNVQVR